jgi:hypothetical protein
LRHAAEGPSDDFSRTRQQLLHAFYVTNLKTSQLDMLNARQQRASAA